MDKLMKLCPKKKKQIKLPSKRTLTFFVPAAISKPTEFHDEKNIV